MNGQLTAIVSVTCLAGCLCACEAELPEVTPVSSTTAASGDTAATTASATPGLRVGTATASAEPIAPVSMVREAAARTPYEASDTLSVDILWDQALRPDAPVAMTVMSMAAGSSVPEHMHADSDEILYVRTGSGTLVIEGTSYTITPGAAVFIPRGTRHSALFDADGGPVEAVQVYAPPGPEQRFKKLAADRAAASAKKTTP